MRIPPFLPSFAIACAFIFASSAQAVVPQSVERDVTIVLLGIDTSQHSTEPGDFDETLSDSLRLDALPGPVYDYTASSTQDSRVDASGVRASGEAMISGGVFTALCGDPSCIPASSRSALEMVFEVTQVTDYLLTGTIGTEVVDTIGGTTFQDHVRTRVELHPLGDPTAPVVLVESSPTDDDPCCETLPVGAWGSLTPGTYRLSVESRATFPLLPVSSGSGVANFEIELSFSQAVPMLPGWGALAFAIALLVGGVLVGRRRREVAGDL